MSHTDFDPPPPTTAHLQVQATVVGFLAAVAAVVLGWIPEGKFQMSHAVLLCSSSVATAFIASLLQGRRPDQTRSDCLFWIEQMYFIDPEQGNYAVAALKTVRTKTAVIT